LHIKEIEFQNFKSFGRKIKIPFLDGFTTISGPNGSGKSNIVDGILFCLGLSSSRTMRAEKLTDLIYNGDGAKKPDFAQVTIRFDNSDREMPVDLDEVAISRKIRQTEAGYYSYFYFNDRAVSLNDIHNYLAKARITPEGYNVVMQGDVTRITEMTPSQRRNIIDEIAGVAEFDHKKNQAMNELEIVRERIERVDIILAEVDVQREKLKNERDQAIKYQSLQQEKIKFEGYVLLLRLKGAKRELRKIIQQIDSLLGAESDLEALLESKKIKMNELSSELDDMNAQITRMGEDEQISIKRQIEEIKGDISLNQNTITLTESEITDMESQRRKGLIEIDNIKEKIADLASQIQQEHINKEGINIEIEDHQTQLLLLQSRIKDVDSSFIKTRDELNVIKTNLEDIRNYKNELMRSEDRILDAMRRRSSYIKDIQDEIEQSKKKIKSADDDREDINVEIQTLEHQIKELDKDISDLESNRSQLKGVLKDLDEKLQQLQQDYIKAQARIKAAKEVSGYSNAVEKILKAKEMRVLPGIYGTIAQLGKVDQMYATALQVAAGGRMQSIVVDTDEDAARAISYLKHQKAGRGTFLPLNKMENPSDYRDNSDTPGIIDYAVNLVDYDLKFELAFHYVFRDTLVVEDIDTARRLMGGRRIVTLEGELIEKSGAMTGGSSARNILSFAASEEDKITRLAEQITEYDSRRSTVINKIDSAESHISSVYNEIREFETEITRKQMEISQINSRDEQLTGFIAQKEVELKEIEEGHIGLRSEIETIDNEKGAVEQQITELTKKSDELKEQLKGSQVPELNEQAQRIADEIRRLENRRRDIDTNINTLNTESTYAANRSQELRTRVSELDVRKHELNEKIKLLRNSITKAELDLADKLTHEHELDEELADMRRQREDLLGEHAAWQKQYEQIKNEQENSQRRMIALSATRDALVEQTKEFKLELDKRGIEITDDVPTQEQIQIRIASIDGAMTRLEPVNMRAIYEYDEVERRSSDLQSRRDILYHEREEILVRIDKYEQMKKQSFMDSYNGINEHFRGIFHELSEGPGELMLENRDDPFAGGLTIKAQPRDKTLQRMEAMSGGEKSLTALAIIFAIQEFRPAPFYAFDEIDMFLDGVNAERVAQRLKMAREHAQFIVVSLRKPMIQAAERTIGVAMQENNITSITGVRFN
jgi:chromosome segregation protein